MAKLTQVETPINRALFLDRDGVVNEDKGYVYRRKDFRFSPGIFEICRYFQSRGYLLFIITNQSGIARGYYTEEDYMQLTNWMVREFEKTNVWISKVYHCPFHPDAEIEKYREDHPDRKPSPGMILKAGEEFLINLNSSILIGDKEEDMLCAKNADLGKRILLRGNYYREGISADHEVDSLLEIKKLGLT